MHDVEKNNNSAVSAAGDIAVEEGPPDYSFTRVMVVILFSYLVGACGGIAFALVLLAPCAVPWSIAISLLGERMGVWALFLVGAGFASGVFIQIQLPAARARFLFLFFGNPAFLFFLLAVLNATYFQDRLFPNDPVKDVLIRAASLAVAGTGAAVLGDRYAWKRKEDAGIA